MGRHSYLLCVEIILGGRPARMNRSLRQLPSTRNPRETGTVSTHKIVTQSPSETALVETFLEGLLISRSESRDRLFLNGNYASYQYQGRRQLSATNSFNTQNGLPFGVVGQNRPPPYGYQYADCLDADRTFLAGPFKQE